MKFSLLILLLVISLGNVAGFEVQKYDINAAPNNLPGVLNWLYCLHKQYPSCKEKCEKGINDLITNYDLKEYETIVNDLYEYIASFAAFRSFLVEGIIQNVEVTCKIVEPLPILMNSFFIMKDIMDDLNYRLVGYGVNSWRYVEDHDTVRHKSCFPWFQSLGFTASTLKNVTIKDLQSKVNAIHVKKDFLEDLVRFAGTAFALNPNNNPSSALSWLATFSSSNDNRHVMQYHLSCIKDMPASITSEVFSALAQVGKINGPLNLLLGKNIGEGLYSRSIYIFKYAKFMLRHAEFHFNILTRICKNIFPQLVVIDEAFKEVDQDDMRFILTQQGFTFKEGPVDVKRLSTHLAALMSQEGPINNLCKIVYKCNKILRNSKVSTEDSICEKPKPRTSDPEPSKATNQAQPVVTGGAHETTTKESEPDKVTEQKKDSSGVSPEVHKGKSEESPHGSSTESSDDESESSDGDDDTSNEQDLKRECSLNKPPEKGESIVRGAKGSAYETLKFFFGMLSIAYFLGFM